MSRLTNRMVVTTMATYTEAVTEELHTLEEQIEQAQIREHLQRLGHLPGLVDEVAPAPTQVRHKPAVTTYSPQWREAREKYLGASEISAICGLDESTGKNVDTIVTKKRFPESEWQPRVNSRAWWGLQIEGSIVTTTLHELGLTHADLALRVSTSWLDNEASLMASPDAVILTRDCDSDDLIPHIATELIEAKMVGPSNAKRWVNGPPVGVVLQAHAQMAVMGIFCRKVHIGVMIEGAPVTVWTINRSDELCEAIVCIARTWWDKYYQGSMTRFEWDEFVSKELAAAGFMRQDVPTRNKQVKVVDNQALEAIDRWTQARAEYRAAEEAKKRYDARIVELMGDADTIADSEGHCLAQRSWINRMSFDTKKLLSEHPELEPTYSYPMSYSRLCVGKGAAEGDVS